MKIKEFLTKIKTKVSTILKKLKKTAQEVLPVGIEVVNIMKTITDSKYVDIITALTPTTADDKAVAVLRTILPKVLKEMEGWDNVIELPDDQIVKQAILTINSYPKIKKNAIYLAVASAINTELSEGALTPSESVLATQAAYIQPEILTN